MQCRGLALIFLLLSALPAVAQQVQQVQQDALYQRVAALDQVMFDAFNHCNDPVQLERHASYFAPDVEFYHDIGGVTWSRDAMLANTRQYVCGHFIRQLVPGSLKVYPIKDFDAIAQGVHQFCQLDSGKCEGMADFVMVWRLQGDNAQITRVLSYGHRAREAAP